MKQPWIIRKSVAHLRGSQMGYFRHFCHAFSLGWILIFNGISSIIHAFIPAFFPGTAAFTTMRIFYKVCYGHPNPYFQRVRLAYEKRYVKERIAERVHKTGQNPA
jgi:hypothetical protein